MMTSHEQVQPTAGNVQMAADESAAPKNQMSSTSAEFVEYVTNVVCALPEISESRVQHARLIVAGNLPPASDLAEKIIERVLLESIS